jgi:hypothetical protein
VGATCKTNIDLREEVYRLYHASKIFNVYRTDKDTSGREQMGRQSFAAYSHN